MDTTADDNFFIEEPSKLRSNFFNKDKSMQMVELLAQKHNDTPIIRGKVAQIEKIQNYRLTYNSNKKMQQIQQPQLFHQHEQQSKHAASIMPKSLICRLEILCQATNGTDDISVAKRAVDTLVSASNVGCCFLEKYIAMLVNFCARNSQPDDETMKIKVAELLDKVLAVHFDRQQLTENLKNLKDLNLKSEFKLASIEHISQLLQRVQEMLDYKEQTAIEWLFVILDAYFVELAKTDKAVDIIDQISARIDFQCALLREEESTRCLLNSILEQLNANDDNNNYNSNSNTSTSELQKLGSQTTTIRNVNNKQLSRHWRPYYSIENIEF